METILFVCFCLLVATMTFIIFRNEFINRRLEKSFKIIEVMETYASAAGPNYPCMVKVTWEGAMADEVVLKCFAEQRNDGRHYTEYGWRFYNPKTKEAMIMPYELQNLFIKKLEKHNELIYNNYKAKKEHDFWLNYDIH